MSRWFSLLPMLVACAGPDTPDEEEEPLDPSAPGELSVDRWPFTFPIADREGLPSQVAVNLYLPSSGADEPVPVVIFNHGFATTPEAMHETFLHLSSWGLAVVAPTWDQGFANVRSHQGLADDLRELMTWLQQNTIPEVEVEMDVTTFGLSGYSRGGKQAMLGAVDDLAELDRVRTVFTIDPVDALPPSVEVDDEAFPSVAPERMAELTVPTGLLGTGYGPTGAVPCAPEGENHEAYWAGMTAPALQVVAAQAGHRDFLDDCAAGQGGTTCNLCPPGDNPEASTSLARGLLVSWFLRHMRDDVRFEAWQDELAQNYEGVTVQER